MRFSARTAVEMLLALAVLCLGTVLFVPWEERPLKTTPSGQTQQLPAPDVQGQVAALQANPDPDAIVLLFIGRVPARVVAQDASTATETSNVPEKDPLEAPWLSYLGFSTTVEGKSSYFFKNTKTGRILKVMEGEISGGWSVVEIKGNRMILRNGDDVYVVYKR